MAFQVTKAAVQEWLDDDTSLQTLKNQYSLDEIFELIENRDAIASDDALYTALIDVMYATRPKGLL
jgi:hypothetical protein